MSDKEKQIVSDDAIVCSSAVGPQSPDDESRRSSAAMCPHCGWRPSWLYKYSLIPWHSFAGFWCPGSMQYPRNANSDRRSMWNDTKDTASVPDGR